jgi:hypothetical protein
MRDRLITWSVATGVATASLWLNVSATAEAHDHRHDEEQKPPRGIVVTINPEARVSVTGRRLTYRSLTCHKPIDLPVKIFNLGFVTAPLMVRLVGNAPSVSSVALLGNGLTGGREENRVLRLFLNHIGLVDLTLAFSIRHGIEDLDGRGRVHLLLECGSPDPME